MVKIKPEINTSTVIVP